MYISVTRKEILKIYKTLQLFFSKDLSTTGLLKKIIACHSGTRVTQFSIRVQITIKDLMILLLWLE